jgi:hypothetical protein
LNYQNGHAGVLVEPVLSPDDTNALCSVVSSWKPTLVKWPQLNQPGDSDASQQGAGLVGAFAAELVLDERTSSRFGVVRNYGSSNLLVPVSGILVQLCFVWMGLKVDLQALLVLFDSLCSRAYGNCDSRNKYALSLCWKETLIAIGIGMIPGER